MPSELIARAAFTALALLFASCFQTVAQSHDKARATESPQRVILYDEDQNDPNGRRYVGSVVWRTETVAPSPGLAPELSARADIQIPDRHMNITWALRRNSDKSLPATHTIEVIFKLGTDFLGGGITKVPGVLLKSKEQDRGAPLAGLAVKVSDNYFLIGLSAKKVEAKRNIPLLQDYDWIDIPIVYSNGKRAILAIQKGESGQRAFAQVLGRTPSSSSANSNLSAAPSQASEKSVAAAVAAAQPPDEGAPLGLTWGATAESLTAQGIELKPFPQKDFGETYIASKLPRALSDQETAFLSFGFDNKLFRVAIVSRGYKNDPSGAEIRARYSELLKTLSEKYGRAYSVQNLGSSIYAQSEYFLAGINGGQSTWYSNFDTPRLVIQLGLMADSSSIGRWRIIFEEKSLKKAFDLARKTKEKDDL